MLAHAHNKFKFKSVSYTASDVLVITVQECGYIIYTFTLYDVTLKVTLKSYRYRESYCKRYRYRYRESYCKRYRYRYHKKLPYMTVNLEVAIEGNYSLWKN